MSPALHEEMIKTIYEGDSEGLKGMEVFVYEGGLWRLTTIAGWLCPRP
jgi:hypothetical protein